MKTTDSIESMKAFINANKKYVSGDDDLSSDAGIIQTAQMVRDRIADDAPNDALSPCM